jgi:hypothetical protein
LAVTLAVLTACGGQSFRLVEHAERHAQGGDDALAYADYRRALHVEVPPGDPAFEQIREKARESFRRWVAARVDAAKAARERGDAYQAYTIVAALLVPDLGAMSWEDKERRFVTLEERLGAEERELITGLAEQTFPDAWKRGVDDAMAVGRIIAAVLRADVLASTFPADHDVRKRASQVREAAATRLAGRPDTAGALFGALHARLAGKPNARAERDTASLRFDDRVQPGTCSEWPEPPALTGHRTCGQRHVDRRSLRGERAAT